MYPCNALTPFFRGALTLTGDATPWTTRYGYDNAGRLRTVLDDRLASGQAYVYTYKDNASLVAQLTAPSGMKVNKTYDTQGRLLTTSALSSQLTALSSFAYTYDAAGQRKTEVTPERTREFGYDQYRQLTGSSATVAGTAETFTYAYDPIGNRLSSEAQSSQLPAPSSLTTYTPNAVNQYEAISSQLIAPTYDLNGNTTAEQGKFLKYDEENRLIEAADATRTIRYVYDGFGRRVERIELPTGSTTPTTATRYVYDGWRVMEELTWTPTTPTWTVNASYTRGLDLSGTPEGAGGIGGLLARSQPNGVSWTTASYLYDGNGNVSHLVGDDNSIKARYAYTPFGERLSATGEWADINTVQFSSKERDSFTGYYYYGLRHYAPNSGRWLSRDPMGERGGVNLLGMVRNNAVNYVDPLGLAEYKLDGCVLKVSVKWRLVGTKVYHPGAAWLREAERIINNYFSNLPQRCINDDKTCCECPGGVKVEFNMQFVTTGEADVNVMASRNPNLWPRQSSDGTLHLPEWVSEGDGRTLIHEAGHSLGLEHPGARRPQRPPLNSKSDYDDPEYPDNLMGRGLTLIDSDFDKAFCSKIKKCNGTWKVRGK